MMGQKRRETRPFDAEPRSVIAVLFFLFLFFVIFFVFVFDLAQLKRFSRDDLEVGTTFCTGNDFAFFDQIGINIDVALALGTGKHETFSFWKYYRNIFIEYVGRASKKIFEEFHPAEEFRCLSGWTVMKTAPRMVANDRRDNWMHPIGGFDSRPWQ